MLKPCGKTRTKKVNSKLNKRQKHIHRHTLHNHSTYMHLTQASNVSYCSIFHHSVALVFVCYLENNMQPCSLLEGQERNNSSSLMTVTLPGLS